jgi:FkbM family methyltransferase
MIWKVFILSVRSFFRRTVGSMPMVDVAFRRFVWSRVSFPEPEMRFLNELNGRPIDVAVDVGAALGGYAWILNRKARRVFAFEPGQAHADFLARGLLGTRIELERLAVGSSSGIVPMYTPGDDTNARHSATLSTGNPVVQSNDTRVTNVQMVSIDQLLSERLAPDERLDLLKVDVEGYELAVFEGARHRIEKDFPLIICEIEARHNVDFAQVFKLLRSIGYVSYTFQGSKFILFVGEDLDAIQTEENLAYRISPEYRPGTSRYINNFIFSHAKSKIGLM